MCVWVWVCVYIYVCVGVWVCVYIFYTYIYICIYTHPYIFYTNMCVYTHICIHTQVAAALKAALPDGRFLLSQVQPRQSKHKRTCANTQVSIYMDGCSPKTTCDRHTRVCVCVCVCVCVKHACMDGRPLLNTPQPNQTKPKPDPTNQPTN